MNLVNKRIEIRDSKHLSVHTLKFIATLFTVAKRWKQTKPIDGWMDTQMYIYTQWNIIQLLKEMQFWYMDAL